MQNVRLGKLSRSTCYTNISEDADNQSLLITGRSGSGKTFALMRIEKNIASDGGAVLVLNYHRTHEKLKGNGKVKWVYVKKDGLPLSLLSALKKPDGTKEDMKDIQEAVIDTFCGVQGLQVKQKRVLRKAIEAAMKVESSYVNEVFAIGKELKRIDNEAADSVYDRFYQLFSMAKIALGDHVIEKGKITVFDFDDFNEETQIMLAEMTLSMIWRYFQVWGQFAKERLYIVCDEFQELNMGKNSMLGKILREGRKYNLALILATQTLDGLDKGQKAILQQAATRLYFRPAPSEIRGILHGLPSENKKAFAEVLENLRRGDCVASGRFMIENVVCERPLKISFRREEENYGR